MAAALGGAATQPLVVALLERVSLAPGVPDLRRGRRRLRGRLVRVVPRRPARAPQRERGGARRDRHATRRPRIPPCPGAGCCAAATWRALCAMYFGAIYGWYFYLTWLPDLSAARARLRPRRGRLAGRAAAARDRDRLAGRRLRSPTRSRVAGARASACARPAWSGCRSPRSRSCWRVTAAGSAHQRVLPRRRRGARRARRRARLVRLPRDRRPPRRRRLRRDEHLRQPRRRDEPDRGRLVASRSGAAGRRRSTRSPGSTSSRRSAGCGVDPTEPLDLP